jgi:membrane-associated protease RseP (regulator of RpoE activity)
MFRFHSIAAVSLVLVSGFATVCHADSPDKPALGITFSPQSLLGALVVDVYPGSPAQRAGFRSGDRILELNGQEISKWEDVNAAIQGEPNNTEVNVLIARAGHKIVLHPKLGLWKPGMGVPSLTPTVMPPMMSPPGSFFIESQDEPWYRLNPGDLDDQHAYGG